MCEARGCGDRHCRVVAERRDVTGLPKQGWLDHMQQPVGPVHQTPEERTVQDGQILRTGRYTNAFGEEKSFAWAYHWVMQMGWVWSVSFPLVDIRDMADDEDEFLRTERIPLSQLVEDVMAGKIADGKTQVASLKVNEILRRRKEMGKA